MLILATVISPLLLCIMAGLSLAFARIYEHITAQTTGQDSHSVEGERDKDDGRAPLGQDNGRIGVTSPSNTKTTTPPPETAHTLEQILDEIKRLRVARSALKGEMVDLIHRLASQEEEILRSELRKTIQEKRAADPHDKTDPPPPKLATIALPSADPEAAIAEAGTPRNRAEVRAFIHSARELSSSNPNQALELQKMHELLK